MQKVGLLDLEARSERRRLAQKILSWPRFGFIFYVFSYIYSIGKKLFITHVVEFKDILDMNMKV